VLAFYYLDVIACYFTHITVPSLLQSAIQKAIHVYSWLCCQGVHIERQILSDAISYTQLSTPC